MLILVANSYTNTEGSYTKLKTNRYVEHYDMVCVILKEARRIHYLILVTYQYYFEWFIWPACRRAKEEYRVFA